MDATDNTPDTYLPMKGSSATALANKQSTKRTIPYPDDDDISEAAATDDNNDDDNHNLNPANGHAIDPKPTDTAAKILEDDTPDEAAHAKGAVESPAK